MPPPTSEGMPQDMWRDLRWVDADFYREPLQLRCEYVTGDVTGPGSQCTINLARWNALPTELQQIIITACAAENEMILAEYNGRSGAALAILVQEHGVKLRQFPLSVLTAFGRESGALMQEIYEQGDELTRKICGSYFRFRRESMAWTRIADQAYANARLLDFSYPEG